MFCKVLQVRLRVGDSHAAMRCEATYRSDGVALCIRSSRISATPIGRSRVGAKWATFQKQRKRYRRRRDECSPICSSILIRDLSQRRANADLRLFWPAEPDTEFTAVLPTFHSIAVASKSSPQVLHILSDLVAAAQERFGAIDLFERPAYRLLGIYGCHPRTTGSTEFLRCVSWNASIRPEFGRWRETVITGIKSIRWVISWTGLS